MHGGGSGQSGGGMAMLMRAMEREECEAGTSLMEQARESSPKPTLDMAGPLHLFLKQEDGLLPPWPSVYS